MKLPKRQFMGPWSIVHSFDDMFENPFWSSKIAREQVIRRGVETYHIETDDKRMVLKIDVPGIKLTDIDVSIVNRTVSISTTEDNREVVHTYTIDEGYDVTKIDAQLDLGVLSLSLPRLAETKTEEQPRKIKITSKS